MPTDNAPRPRVAPGFTPPDRLHSWTVPGSDGIARQAWLWLPGSAGEQVPLVVSPHPFGFTARINLFGENAGPRTAVDLAGIVGAAQRHGTAVLSLQSEGSRYTGTSVGLPAQLEAYRAAIAAVLGAGLPVDPGRIWASGLSMGGQESLLLAARFPGLVCAVAVQNAVTDLAAWFWHLAASEKGTAHAAVIEAELGAAPGQSPRDWDERSPVAHVKELARTPVQVRLNDIDDIVPAATQGRLFADALGQAGGTVSVIDDLPGLLPADPGRSAHEYANWDAMLSWLAAQR